MDSTAPQQTARRLIQLGILLFLLGLLTGFAIPVLENPRMGLSSHLEGTLNGMFLILAGLIWPKLHLPATAQRIGFGLLVFGTFVNWGTTFLAALWGAGSDMMPFAGAGLVGAAWQEALIKAGLISLSLAMVAASGLLFWGMRGRAA